MQEYLKQGEEIFFKELVINLKGNVIYLKKYWLLILIVSVIGGTLGLTYSIIKKPRYTAECTFVLEEGEKGGGLGAYAGIASMVGIDLGGGGGLFQGDNIMELYNSRRMLEKTLLTRIPINQEKPNDTVSLVDLYVSFNKLREK